MSADLADELSSLIGEGVGVGWSLVSDDERLWPEEAAAVARAIPKRRAEFAAGRRAARDALRAMGKPFVAIPVGEGRAPVWPQGICGAITHDAGIALAAVADDASTLGLGIDLTEASPLPEQLRQEILPHPDERNVDPLTARIGFSAKESLFKALYPQVGTYFGFDAAVFSMLPDADRFEVTLSRDVGTFSADTTWAGILIRRANVFVTAIKVQKGYRP